MINKHCTVHTHWAHLIYIQLSSNKSQRHNSAYIPTKINEHLVIIPFSGSAVEEAVGILSNKQINRNLFSLIEHFHAK